MNIYWWNSIWDEIKFTCMQIKLYRKMKSNWMISIFYLPETKKWARSPMATATTVSNDTTRRAIIHGFKSLLWVPNPTSLWKRKITSYSHIEIVTDFLVLLKCMLLSLPFSARRHLSSVLVKVILAWREVLKNQYLGIHDIAPGFYF